MSSTSHHASSTFTNRDQPVTHLAVIARSAVPANQKNRPSIRIQGNLFYFTKPINFLKEVEHPSHAQKKSRGFGGRAPIHSNPKGKKKSKYFVLIID